MAFEDSTHSELSFAVDEESFGVLSRVGSQSSREPFLCVFVHPVGEEHHVGREVIVIQVAVGVERWRLSHHYATVDTVQLLQTCKPSQLDTFYYIFEFFMQALPTKRSFKILLS